MGLTGDLQHYLGTGRDDRLFFSFFHKSQIAIINYCMLVQKALRKRLRQAVWEEFNNPQIILFAFFFILKVPKTLICCTTDNI